VLCVFCAGWWRVLADGCAVIHACALSTWGWGMLLPQSIVSVAKLHSRKEAAAFSARVLCWTSAGHQHSEDSERLQKIIDACAGMKVCYTGLLCPMLCRASVVPRSRGLQYTVAH
jgi:hypothetical protein